MSTLIVDLCHYRWTLPVLAEIQRLNGARFVTLSGTLEVGNDSLRRTLAALQHIGLVEKNAGYGHPLRPEYLLTKRGRILAPAASNLLETLHGREQTCLKKWSLPTLFELTAPRRFSELRSRLPSAGPRALTLALKDLQTADLVQRTVFDSYPPTVLYLPTTNARPIVTATRQLATLTH